LNNHPILQRIIEWLPKPLEQLDLEVPLTMVHHDYHAKNIVKLNGGRILAIDWSNAYLSPPLGDLYCLMNEAHSYADVSEEEIIFTKELNDRMSYAMNL
jgi:thiamine kinase-like enzyme